MYLGDAAVTIKLERLDKLREALAELTELKKILRNSIDVVDSEEDIVTVDVGSLIEIARQHVPDEILRLLDYEGYALRRIN